MLYSSEVQTGGNYWCDLAQLCSELRIMLADSKSSQDYVKMAHLSDRFNGDTRHSNQDSREHLEGKDWKLHFLQTGIVLVQGGRSVRNRTGCWIFVKRLPENKVYRDQWLDLLVPMEPM